MSAVPAVKAGSLRVTAALEPGLAAGDPVPVERLVCNLIDNAVRHNTPGGWLDRRCQQGEPDAPEGSGLGLSIVQSVLKAHHGDIAATPLPSGGLAVTVRLPVA